MASCHPFFIHIFSLHTMRIAISGITGHIGNNVARALLAHDYTVSALVRNTSAPSIQNLNIELIRGDLFNSNSLDALCNEKDIMIHIAGKVSIYEKDRKEVMQSNIQGVKNIIEACRRNGVKKIIHFSSVKVHKGEGKNVSINENSDYVDTDESIYNYSKSLGEKEMIRARESGLDVTILNPTAVIGPYDFQPSLTGKMLVDIYKGKMPFLVNAGFDWLDVRDISEAILSIIKLNVQNEKFILSGHWAEFKDVAQLVYGTKNQKYNGMGLPIWLAKTGLPFVFIWSKIVNTEPLYTAASLKAIEEGSMDTSFLHAKKVLNYTPRPLSETIHDSMQWFKSNNNI